MKSQGNRLIMKPIQEKAGRPSSEWLRKSESNGIQWGQGGIITDAMMGDLYG